MGFTIDRSVFFTFFPFAEVGTAKIKVNRGKPNQVIQQTELNYSLHNLFW